MTAPPDPAHVARAYDLWAARYDTDENRTRDLAGRVLRAAGLELAGRDVLELGCGTGRNTEWLATGARAVVALDFSDGMLAEARRRVGLPSVRFVPHDVRRAWPVADASVDLIVVTLVLEHVEALPPVFNEAARVLRPGGTIFCAELHPMRQLLGRQAEFTDPATGELARIAAFLHDASEYVRSGLAAGLVLTDLGEWRDDEADRTAPPRLISVRFTRP
ncbi:MAG: class I SAM-dependent methyltransferase [Gemmatimonadota bacterium]|nr:class I SAM-dependent methyltransferase [Gemmatimonadota bacterium]